MSHAESTESTETMRKIDFDGESERCRFSISLIVFVEYAHRPETFCLSASPDKQKILSLRPRRLCGETIILDKSDNEY